MHIPDYKLLAKQPIYDASKNCVAHELLFRSPMNLSVKDVGAEIATNQVLVNYCASVSEQAETANSLVFINVDAEFLADYDSLPVPPEKVVIELEGDSEITETLIEALLKWRKKGFKFALDAYGFSEAHDQILEHVDYAKVNILSHGIETLRDRMASVERGKITWIAECIEEPYIFDACKEMGFDLFQGYFLAKPTEVMGNSIRPGTAVTVRIIKDLDKPGITMKEISNLVAQDPKLTVQMLKIINSSLFSLPKPVSDLEAALIYLGIDMLRQWAMILAFLSNGSVHLEACRLVLLRAKTCELNMMSRRRDADLASAAFLAGLVSGVDVLLNVMPEVFLKQVSLSPVISQAVLDKSGDLGEVLSHVSNMEYTVAQMRNDVTKVEQDLLDAYGEASGWVNGVMKVLNS